MTLPYIGEWSNCHPCTLLTSSDGINIQFNRVFKNGKTNYGQKMGHKQYLNFDENPI